MLDINLFREGAHRVWGRLVGKAMHHSRCRHSLQLQPGLRSVCSIGSRCWQHAAGPQRQCTPAPLPPPAPAACRLPPLPARRPLRPPRSPALPHARRPPADKGGNPEVVRESQRRRYADVGLVDKVLELDAKWREGERRTCSARAPAAMIVGAATVAPPEGAAAAAECRSAGGQASSWQPCAAAAVAGSPMSPCLAPWTLQLWSESEVPPAPTASGGGRLRMPSSYTVCADAPQPAARWTRSTWTSTS